jgi:hypothetical protein
MATIIYLSDGIGVRMPACGTAEVAAGALMSVSRFRLDSQVAPTSANEPRRTSSGGHRDRNGDLST